MPSRPLLLTLAAFLGALSASADSLWLAAGGEERSMYADRKAGRVGDILTISVAENAATSSSQRKKTDSGSSIDAGISQFLFPPAVDKFGTKGGQLPGIKMGGTNSTTGGGEVANSQSITTRAAVLVTAVLPNGNLVIEGVRRVTFAGETQHVVLHGVVRPDDISSANVIASSNIADSRVEFLSEGDLTEAAKKGWISNLYEKLRPY